jgi:hypothetical protein
MGDARSWDDLDAQVEQTGSWLACKGQGLIVTDGKRYAKWSQLATKPHRLSALEKRYGQRFVDWQKTRQVEGDLSAWETF